MMPIELDRPPIGQELNRTRILPSELVGDLPARGAASAVPLASERLQEARGKEVAVNVVDDGARWRRHQKVYSTPTSGVTLSRSPFSSSLNRRFTSSRSWFTMFVFNPKAPLSAL